MNRNGAAAFPTVSYRKSAVNALRRVFAIAASFFWLGALLACTSPPRPQSTPLSAEDRAEFGRQMTVDAAKAKDYLQQTQKGRNLSEFTLGWFVYGVLTEVSAQDTRLYDHFAANGGDVQQYLKKTFNNQPEREISAVGAMTKQGDPLPPLIARNALEALRHIPNSREAEEIQTRDRNDLARALTGLESCLRQAADELAASSAAGPPPKSLPMARP
jgi:hypothetical protein